MAEIAENLWSKDFLVNKINVPKSILVQQAKFLEQMTGNVLTAEVNSTAVYNDPHKILHSFRVTAPFVGNVKVVLFTVTQNSIHLYPISVKNNLSSIVKDNISNEDELKTALKEIFNDSETVQVLSSLMSQSEVAA